jgi:drug/metabolite transporter (DMT)-like permease
VIIMLLLMNVNIKHHAFDSIQKKHMNVLCFRIFATAFTVYCTTYSVKNLPLVLTGIVKNMTPLFTALFSYFLLKEGISRIEILCLLVAFLGVYIVISGNTPTNSEQ